MSPEIVNLIVTGVAVVAGWALRHWGIMAPGPTPTPTPNPVPTPAPAPVPSPGPPAIGGPLVDLLMQLLQQLQQRQALPQQQSAATHTVPISLALDVRHMPQSQPAEERIMR